MDSHARETLIEDSGNEDTSTGSFHAGLVKGSGPRLGAETRELLRTRLRAAGVVLTGAWVLGILQSLLVPVAASMPTQMPTQLIGLVAAGGFTAVLHLKPVFSLRQLRLLELGMIFSAAMIGGVLQFIFLSELADHGTQELLAAFLGQSGLVYIWLMLFYGMFIPNTWRRAARVIGLIALLPIGIRVALRFHYPALSELLGPDQAMLTLFMLLVSAVSAVYGTHVVNTLRKEAHQARKLGQYQLVSRIGRGAMGEVWRATHQMLARPAAVKLIRPEALGDLATEDTQMSLR